MAFSRFKPPRRRPPDPEALSERPRVLYVEDEDINWEIAQHELEGRFDITRATSPREAFALLARQRFHLILLDIQLSGSDIDGVAMAKLLKGRYPGPTPDYAFGVRAENTPIIFVTAYTTLYPRDKALAAGGDDIIAKPVDFTRLSLAVARVWGRGVPGG